jgi:hypothetical protein
MIYLLISWFILRMSLQVGLSSIRRLLGNVQQHILDNSDNLLLVKFVMASLVVIAPFTVAPLIVALLECRG